MIYVLWLILFETKKKRTLFPMHFQEPGCPTKDAPCRKIQQKGVRLFGRILNLKFST